MTTATMEREKPATNGGSKHDKVLATIELARTTWRTWQAEPGEEQNPPAALIEAAIDVVLTLATGPIDNDFDFGIAKPVEDLGETLLAMLNVRDFIPGRSIASHSFYEALQRIEDRLVHLQKGPPQIESVADLLRQHVSTAQIARIHGLTEAQIEVEKATPGSICGPGYVPPSAARNREKHFGETSDGLHLSVLAKKLRETLRYRASFRRA